MTGEQTQALKRATTAFKFDTVARERADQVRSDLVKAIKAAHQTGVSDQKLASAFRNKLSRARIQQMRSGTR